MKKFITLLLCAVTLLGATGCSFLHREYSSVTPHNATYYESTDKNALRAENYQDLVNDLLILIDRRAEAGTIHLYTATENLDADTAMAEAMLETQYETPLGAYAVEFISYKLGDAAVGHTVLEVEFGYRRTAQQMEAIVHATGVSALNTLLPAAVDSGAEELVLEVGYFQNRAELDEIIAAVREEKAVSGPWQVNLYPNETDAGIIEIIFSPAEEAVQTRIVEETE